MIMALLRIALLNLPLKTNEEANSISKLINIPNKMVNKAVDRNIKIISGVNPINAINKGKTNINNMKTTIKITLNLDTVNKMVITDKIKEIRIMWTSTLLSNDLDINQINNK